MSDKVKITHKRTPEEKVRDRELIANLFCSGLTEFEITKKLNANYDGYTRSYTLSRPYIIKELKAITAKWAKEAADNQAEQKQIMLRKLRHIENQAEDQFKSSLEDKVETEYNAAAGEKTGKPIKIKKTKHCGDARFLTVKLNAIERQCKLLGISLDKIELTGADGKPIQVEEISESEELLARAEKALREKWERENAKRANPETPAA